MSKFFKHAPVRETHQRRFLEAVRQGRHVVASLPLAYTSPALYGLVAMMGDGLCVVVCPDAETMARNRAWFEQAGYGYPAVAVYEELHEADRDRVQVVLTTPDRFASLSFLDLLVHARLRFIWVETAERLLMPEHSYHPLQEGLSLFRALPPLVLAIPPLPHGRVRTLAGRLGLTEYEYLPVSPAVEQTRIRVHCLLTERQKRHHLLRMLSAPWPGGKHRGPGSVLIQVQEPDEAERLTQFLTRSGFDPTWWVHTDTPAKERDYLIQVLNHRPQTILVNAGVDVRHWQPPPLTPARLVYWEPPASLDDLLIQTFRFPDIDDVHPVRLDGMILHTRTDYQAALSRYKRHSEAYLQLVHYRRWVLSEECRRQSLMAYYQGSDRVSVPPCGVCDRCMGPPEGWLARHLRPWLY